MTAARATKPTVLALLGAYWPANAASGPNQSFRAMCEALSDEFDFRLVARDRPFGMSGSTAPRGWTDIGFAAARYCRIGRFGADGLDRILRETPHDLLMLNGFFDREFTLPALIMRRLGLVPRRPTVLSPRGEFASGALGLKSGVKRAYVTAARRAGLLSDVWLHATGPREREDIARGFPWARGVLDAPNVRVPIARPTRAARDGSSAILRLIFLGRISPVKNLHFAIEVLRQVRSPARLEIYGPVADADYWTMCQAAAAALPQHVSVCYHGEIDQDEVPSALAANDLLFLPTRGENFGHAIFEALACGVPVVISDQTPWQDLQQQKAGWSLPLDNAGRFADALDGYVEMAPESRVRLAQGARAVAQAWLTDADSVGASARMLHAALRGAIPAR